VSKYIFGGHTLVVGNDTYHGGDEVELTDEQAAGVDWLTPADGEGEPTEAPAETEAEAEAEPTAEEAEPEPEAEEPAAEDPGTPLRPRSRTTARRSGKR
jgi:hypothetical protein